MMRYTSVRVALAIASVTVACDQGGAGESSSAAKAPASASPGAARPQPSAARPKWPAEPCSILPAEEVAAWLGAPVTSRVQVTTCDYLTAGEDGAHVSYYRDDAEYRIAKAMREKRGNPGTPVAGLGVEAEYGSTGNDGGLDVVLADGRSFRVSARKPQVDSREAAAAVARLVLAKL